MLKKIHTDSAPAAIGPYSQAIAVGDTLYTSGQIPVDPTTGKVVAATISQQTEQVMKNLAAVLMKATVIYNTLSKQLAS